MKLGRSSFHIRYSLGVVGIYHIRSSGPGSGLHIAFMYIYTYIHQIAMGRIDNWHPYPLKVALRSPN